MLLSKSQIAILKYVEQNQPCKAMDIIVNSKMKHSAVYNFLKTDYFIKSNKIIGAGSPKGGGFYYLYTINENRKDSVICNTIKPIRIKQHPIMQALYSL